MSGVAVVFDRLGPYHVSRLEAAGRLGPVVGVELFAHTDELVGTVTIFWRE